MAMTRWDPFDEALSLRQASDRLLENSVVGPLRSTADASSGTAVDVVEQDGAVKVTASLPGVRPEDLSVSLTDNALTIRGEVRREDEDREGRYHRKERYYGAFARTVALPVPVQAEKAEASFEDGVLTVTLPKTSNTQSTHIPIYSHRRRPSQETEERPAGKPRDNGATQPAESAAT